MYRRQVIPDLNTIFENPLKMSQLNFSILAFSTNLCPIKIDLSGNTVCPQATIFPKTRHINFVLIVFEL